MTDIILPHTNHSSNNSDHKPSANGNLEQDYEIISLETDTNSPILLALNKKSQTLEKIHLFPFQGDAPSIQYKSWAKFSGLAHPNLIRHQSCIDKYTILDEEECPQDMSVVITEHASYGSLYDCFWDHPAIPDKVLVRSIFLQIIEGLDYLHQAGVAHLGLDLHNILIGENFGVKIGSIGMVTSQKDTKCQQRGSEFFRSAELSMRELEAHEERISADIFAAAMILFVLYSGKSLAQEEGQNPADQFFFDLIEGHSDSFWKFQEKSHKNYKATEDQDFFD